ncbi:MAG: PhzF family phenazine biosynthesis protein [Thermodesulfovibrionales bacterium]
MTQGNPFFLLDVFAERKYAGNQLAVVRIQSPLPDSEMQQIAREVHFSETTFIMPPGGPASELDSELDRGAGEGYPVRIFTPEREIPFAGHPVLGTAYVIQREIIGAPVDSVLLSLKAGRVPVSLLHAEQGIERLTMRQGEPRFGQSIPHDEAAELLQLESTALDRRFPVQEVSTGLPFLIIPLRGLEGVRKARVHGEKYRKLIENTEAKALFLFCPETYREENHLNARMFGDYYGIPEDPATGSAAGCLAAWLLQHDYCGASALSLRLEQGYEMGRPSLLFLDAEKREGIMEIRVGGRVVEVARGVLG